MVALQIRDVPDDVRDALARNAARRGQSLQAYLLEVVTRDARFARNVELLADAGASGIGATREDVLDALDAGRRHSA